MKYKFIELVTACRRAGLRTVHLHGSRWFAILRQNVNDTPDEVLTACWVDHRAGKDYWGIPSFWKESTYNSGMAAELELSQLLIKFTMYPGESMTGECDGPAFAVWEFLCNYKLKPYLMEDLLGALQRQASNKQMDDDVEKEKQRVQTECNTYLRLWLNDMSYGREEDAAQLVKPLMAASTPT